MRAELNDVCKVINFIQQEISHLNAFGKVGSERGKGGGVLGISFCKYRIT